MTTKPLKTLRYEEGSRTYRDGTSQQARFLSAMAPEYFSIEEHSLEDLLRFAQRYGKEVQFYDEQLNAIGDWAKFLGEDEEFIQKIIAYIKDPKAFADTDDLSQLTQPHRVLLYSFLLLLRYPQQQFRELTQRYLEFYYRDCLKLKEQEQKPDSAHIVFKLANNQNKYLLKKGTLLSTDDDLQYSLNKDIIVNHAEIANIKTLSIKKATTNILATIHEQGDKSDDSFEAMLRQVLGFPQQGDNLPPDSNDNIVDIDSLKALYLRIKNQNPSQMSEADRSYIIDKLYFLTTDDFKFCLETHISQLDSTGGSTEPAPSPEQWLQVYEIVEKAYHKKITMQRRAELLTIYEQPNGFNLMMRYALGEPNPGDALPPFPSGYSSLQQLATHLDELAVTNYVADKLQMSVQDFRNIIDFDANASSFAKQEVCRLVERAQTKKRNFIHPPLENEEIKDISAQTIFDQDNKDLSNFTRFKAFGQMSTSSMTDTGSSSLGFAVQSPLLFLKEGEREIVLNISFKETGFNAAQFKEIINAQEVPFQAYLSGEEQWIQPSSLSVKIGNFILAPELITYSEGDTFLIGTTGNEVLFTSAHQNHYLHLTNGMIYKIKGYLVDDATKIILSAAGKIPYDENLLDQGFKLTKYTAISLQSPQNLAASVNLVPIELSLKNLYPENAQYLDSATAIFSISDANQFIIWTDGTIYEVEQVITGSRLVVSPYGYFPEFNNATVRKSIGLTKSLGTNFRNLLSLVMIYTEGTNLFTTNDDLNAIVWDNGQVFKIIQMVNTRRAEIKVIGEVLNRGQINKYAQQAIFLNCLQLNLNLISQQPAITTPKAATMGFMNSKVPLLKIMLNGSEVYDSLRNLRLEKVKIAVNVSNIKDFTLRNDNSILDSSGPFQPFGYEPKKRARLYVANEEICYKPLTNLSLHIKWMGLPDSFTTHYDAYSKLLGKNIADTSFQAKLQLIDEASVIPIEAEKNLFTTTTVNNQIKLNTSADINFSFNTNTFLFMQSQFFGDKPENPSQWQRYFQLELGEQDFQHINYPVVMSKISLAKDTDTVNGTPIKSLVAYPPYTPSIQELSIDYSAAVLIEKFSQEDQTHESNVVQIHPFGNVLVDSVAETIQDEKVYYLLPQFAGIGQLFIGIKNMETPSNLSLLFQIITTSGNHDNLTEKPQLRWSYLSQNQWLNLDKIELLSDSTNGLTDTGIIEFQLPEKATNNHTLMPSGLHWLRASINKEFDISEITEIHAQAAIVTLQEQGKTLDHLNRSLPAYSINSLAIPDANVREIIQPYNSFGGKLRESTRAFWLRASERLRHKQRALTSWDYEHLVLAAFPQIYKVKCLTQADQMANVATSKVTVVVIPDITNSKPFLPLEPKAPLQLLEEIKQFLERHTSPFVTVEVKNPRYEEVRYRLAVRFRDQSEQGYYFKKLNEDMKQFLSPWAYEAQADISFGSHIYNSQLIHFIEKLPYIDYVANLTLIEQKINNLGVKPDESFVDAYNSDVAWVHYPDSILVSAPDHVIDLINNEGYQEQYYEGLGYMIINVDFFIA